MRIEAKPLDFTSLESPLDTFLGPSFRDPTPFVQAKKQIDSRSFPRAHIAKILEKYNSELGVNAVSLENVQRLALPNSYCVVTGQQLGMMGGPAYTILKALSCLLVARHTGAIPIFWLATEDHDIHEIDHTYLIDELGNLKRFHLSMEKSGFAVEDLKLTSKNIEEMESFWRHLGLDKHPLPSSGELYSRSMIEVLVSLFAGTGLVFLEPKLLRPLAVPFFSKEIQACEQIRDVLNETTKALVEAGGEANILVGEPTNLFLKDKTNKRKKIRPEGDAFIAGSEKYSLKELLAKIENEPEAFSPNVSARPVLQNTLLPVIAYVAGPAEFAYHRQLGAYHAFHEAAMPYIIPRLSATFIPPEATLLLKSCKLEPWNEIPLHRNGIQGRDLHVLRNLIYPHQGPQERLLNWWGFQAKSRENLVKECLAQLSWDSNSSYYVYL